MMTSLSARIGFAACCLAGAVGTTPVWADSLTADTGVKRALLIGINKYRAVPRLQGSLNDIETMRRVLVTRWGFAESRITMLADEAATRAGILTALNQLVNEAGPNDTVYVHYSGHGSQVEDLNGDEVDDHLDETLVPQDGRSGGVLDITDDELDAIFARMRTRNALIVLDSCHSGTATRSLDIRTRSIPPDTRVDLYRHAETERPQTRAIVPVITSRYVVMTGAASHQEALDGPVDGRFHGFFTYALSKSLSTTPITASPRDVLAGVERELKRIQTHFGRSSMPEPQLETPPELLDKPLLAAGRLFGEVQTSRLPWVEVRPVDATHVLLINGPLLGAAPGSVWSLYPAGETRFAPGRAIAVATVTQTTEKDAGAILQPSGAKIPAGARAVLLLPAPTSERIPIRLLEIPPDRRKSIEETIRNNVREADLVGPDTQARFLIDVQEQSLRLLTADGLQTLATFKLGTPWGHGLATIVSRSANATELLTLDNPSSQLHIDVRVSNTPATRTMTTMRGVAVVAADTQPAKYRIRRPNEPRGSLNSLQLEVRVNTDSYLTIVDVDSEGNVNLLFPNAYQKSGFHPDGFVKANELVLIPDSLEPDNRAGFYWDYSPPKGTDTVRVFSSTDLQTAQMIRDRVQSLHIVTAQTRGQMNARSVSSALRKLRQSLSNRGILTVYDPSSHMPEMPIMGQPVHSDEAAVAPSIHPMQPIEPTVGNALLPPEASDAGDLLSPTAAADWAATTVTIALTD